MCYLCLHIIYTILHVSFCFCIFMIVSTYISMSSIDVYTFCLCSFNVALTLTQMELAILEASSATWNLQANMDSILNASSHGAVIAAVDRMLLYIGALKIPAVSEFFTSHHWHTMLEK